MRGVPVGIFYPSSKVYEVSLACSQLTHFDPVAAHCSAWLNMMVSDMCRGISRDTAFRHARSLCTNLEVHTILGNYSSTASVTSLDAVLCSHASLSCFMNASTLKVPSFQRSIWAGMQIPLVPAVVRWPGRAGGLRRFRRGGYGIFRTIRLSCIAQNNSGNMRNNYPDNISYE